MEWFCQRLEWVFPHQRTQSRNFFTDIRFVSKVSLELVKLTVDMNFSSVYRSATPDCIGLQCLLQSKWEEEEEEQKLSQGRSNHQALPSAQHINW